MNLHDVAPRLARARDQLLREQGYRHYRRRHLRSEVLRLERLVAHRELQEVRAGTTGNRRYIAKRGNKLEVARRTLQRKRREQAALDSTPLWNLLESTVGH